jgi:hypothetical protein
MMLAFERDSWAESEIGQRTSETPDCGAGSTVDFINGTCVSCRDEVMAIARFSDRVQVKVISSGGVILCCSF